MVEKIKDPAKAEAWIRKALADKARIMGFGHRVYRVEDPRAKHLRRLATELGRADRRHALRARSSTRWPRVGHGREAHLSQRRSLLGRGLRGHGHLHRPVHADLRDEPRGGVGGPRARAARQQPADPPALGVHRGHRRRGTSRSPSASASPARPRPAGEERRERRRRAVVLVVWNQLELTRACLESLRACHDALRPVRGRQRLDRRHGGAGSRRFPSRTRSPITATTQNLGLISALNQARGASRRATCSAFCTTIPRCATRAGSSGSSPPSPHLGGSGWPVSTERVALRRGRPLRRSDHRPCPRRRGDARRRRGGGRGRGRRVPLPPPGTPRGGRGLRRGLRVSARLRPRPVLCRARGGLALRGGRAPFVHHGGGTRTGAGAPFRSDEDLPQRRAALRRFAAKWRHRLPSDVRSPVAPRVRAMCSPNRMREGAHDPIREGPRPRQRLHRDQRGGPPGGRSARARSSASATGTGARALTASCSSCRRGTGRTSGCASSTRTAARPRSRATACASSRSTSGITAAQARRLHGVDHGRARRVPLPRRDGRMNLVTVEMGRCTFVAPEIPMNGPEREVVRVPLRWTAPR